MFRVDPGWYEAYWFGERPPAPRPVVSRTMARLAVMVALVCGGAALVNHFHPKDPWQGYEQWEHE